MFCLTPSFEDVEPSFVNSDAKDGFLRLPYGFILDSVNYTEQKPEEDHDFLLFPNPFYEPFEATKYKSEYLTINVC